MTRKPLDSETSSARRVFLTGIIIVAAAAAVATIGISNRAKSVQEVTRWTNEQAIPTVAVVTPALAPGRDELVLPGNIEAYYTGLIFARASGYVKQWEKDIGTYVKQGEVLALIDTPDLDQQLAQARADLQTAQANEKLSNMTAGRWQTLAQRDIVSHRPRTRRWATCRPRRRPCRRRRPMWRGSSRCSPSIGWSHPSTASSPRAAST